MTLLWVLFLLALCAACFGVPAYFLGVEVGSARARKERDATVDRLLGITPAEDAAPTGGLTSWDF